MRDAIERILGLVTSLRDDARVWATGRSVWARLPLLLYLAYAGARHTADPMYRSWFAGLTLILHEMGHLFFSGFGRTLMILGGSIAQITIPLVVALYLLLRQRDWFGLAVGGSWLAFSHWDMATYMADASREELPLVSFGGTPEHDWSTLFTDWHVLNHCDAIAAAVRTLAFGTWASSITLGGLLCWWMWKTKDGTNVSVS